MINTIIKEIKELFHDKRIWTVILTVLIIMIIGTSYNIMKTEYKTSDMLRLGVINKDDSSYSDLLLSYFNGSKTFSSLISVVIGEEEEIKESFIQGDLDIYLEIPENFAENMIKIEHSPINVIINIQDTTKALLFKNILLSYEKYISAVEVNSVGLYDIMKSHRMSQKEIDDTNYAVSMDMIFTALGKEKFFSFQEIDNFPATKISTYYLMSVMVLTLMYLGLYAGFKILREIKEGTFTRIRTTKLSLCKFLTSKILFFVFLLSVYALALCWVLMLKRVTAGMVFYCIAVSFFCVAFSMLLSAFFTTSQRYILVGNLLVFYFAVIGGGIIPIMYLPQKILRISKLTPFYYITEGMMRLDQGQTSQALRTGSVFFLISFVFAFITILLFYRRRMNHAEA